MHVITEGKVAAPNIFTEERIAEQMRAAGIPMFGYQFSKRSNFNYQGLVDCSPKSHNICHSYELPFVFNNFVQLEVTDYVPMPGSKSDRRVARAMTRAWTGFAKNPRTGWGYPAIVDPQRGPYVDFNTDIRLVRDMGSRVGYSVWEPLLQDALSR